MEFGVFLNGYLPGQAAHDPECEHEMLKREIAYVVEADKYNWKYAWVGEHHSLTEYSHMSAPEVVMGYLAHATERIHVGTGIMNLSPRVNHPVRCAERVTMLDHLFEGRFEWGTGRGAGSHEIAAFNILDKNSTKAEWNEVIRQIPRMWEEKDYMYEGESFTVPYPHNILPKPYQGKGHPPIWVGCGNPGTFTQAGELGIGAIAFNFEPIYNLQGPHRRLQGGHRQLHRAARAVQERQRDDDQRRHLPQRPEEGPAGGPAPRPWLPLLPGVQLPRHHPPSGGSAGLAGEAAHHHRRGHARLPHRGGWLLCGEPDEVAEQVTKYQTVGCDQLVFGLPSDSLMEDEVHEMLEVFGSKVIPQFDPDPIHSTTRYRQTAQRKYKDFNFPVPDITVEELPTNAMIQLDGTRTL